MKKKPYPTVAVFSGGGTRYALYLGMYAAMQHYDVKPDLLIATCGGSIAANIINSFATDEQRKAFIQSEELYRFVQNTQMTRFKMLYKIGVYCQRKVRNTFYAPYIENIFDKFIVDMPTDIRPLLPSLAVRPTLPTIVVGARLLFDRADIGKERNGRKLYRKVLFTDAETAMNIDLPAVNCNFKSYEGSAIDSQVELFQDVPLPIATRISVSDMFYVQPVHYNGAYFAGGIIDLMPIELAEQLGETIIFEKKKGFGTIDEALIRAVFGYSGNRRLQEVMTHSVNYWVDTADMNQALSGHYIEKNINLLKLQVELKLPKTYAQFVKDMNFQWQYGYDRVAQHFKNKQV